MISLRLRQLFSVIPFVVHLLVSGQRCICCVALRRCVLKIASFYGNAELTHKPGYERPYVVAKDESHFKMLLSAFTVPCPNLSSSMTRFASLVEVPTNPKKKIIETNFVDGISTKTSRCFVNVCVPSNIHNYGPYMPTMQIQKYDIINIIKPSWT